MSSRDQILAKLKAARQPFTDIPIRTAHLPVVKNLPTDDLLSSFVQKAEALACQVTVCDTDETAIQQILSIIGAEKIVTTWDFACLPVTGLEAALAEADLTQEVPKHRAVKIGITGADAGLAASGSLVLKSGSGQGRQVSLLPYTHIAVLDRQRIVRDLETWLSTQREDIEVLRQVSKINIISGPSRTADIAMTLVMGAHGPAQLHIVIV